MVANVLSSDDAPDRVGGIDLNPTKFTIESEAGSRKMDQKINIPEGEGVEINGLYPVIINVVPITNLPLLLSKGKRSTPFGNLTFRNRKANTDLSAVEPQKLRRQQFAHFPK